MRLCYISLCSRYVIILTASGIYEGIASILSYIEGHQRLGRGEQAPLLPFVWGAGAIFEKQLFAFQTLI